MTREEAKREIDSLDYYLQNHTDDYGEESHTAMMMAIDALEQEPCEDAISRKDLISHIENQSREWGEDYDAQQILGDIEDMPSVKPQERTGHWVKGKCDQCGGHAPFWSMATTYYESEYCPKCGCRMFEPQKTKQPEISSYYGLKSYVRERSDKE